MTTALHVRSIAEREAEVLAKLQGKESAIKRSAEVVGVVDEDARTVEIAFSSDVEVTRWFGIEVLSHDEGACDLARLNDGGAVLWGHDWSDQRGVVEKAWIDADGKGRAVVRFGRSALADELFQDVKDGIKRHVSVGYFVRAAKITEEREDVDVYTITRWEPYEISFVSVPADTSVGVGRSAEIPPEEPTAQRADDAPATAQTPEPATTTKARNAPMDEDEKKTRDTANAAGVSAERARVRAITDTASKFDNVDGVSDLARDALANGTSPEDFQRSVLDKLEQRASKPLNDQLQGADIGLSDREVRQYSLMKVIRHLADPTDKRAARDAALEMEASDAAREKQEKPSERFVIPTDVLRRPMLHSMDNIRAPLNTGLGGNATTGATGGNLIATTLLSSSFIDLLRSKATIMSMARVIGGLVGNIDIPKQLAGATGYWIGEDADAGETGIEFGQIAMSPKTVAAFSEITRRMLNQSSLDVEALLRADLAIGMALEMDRAGYYGTGAGGEPLGITNVTGINAVDFATAGQPTYAELVAMETAIALDNADVDSMAYIANAGFRGHAKTTLKFAANGASTIWEPGNQVNGYEAKITNQVAAGDVVMGNFADFIVAMWGGLEMTVDPYSNSKKGRIRVVTFQDVDFATRRNQSFCLGRAVP